MDSDPPSESPRKVKFTPKGPPRRPAKSATAKIEKAEDDGSDDVEAEQRALLRRVQGLSRRGSKVEKKSSAQVVFSHGVSSTPLRTFGKPRERTKDSSEGADAEEVAFDNGQISYTSPSTDKTDVEETYNDSTDDAIKKKKREYMEPWDYEHSYYPVTLPLRRPYSGEPELLDEAEFDEAAEYDENTLSSAKELGLLDEGDIPTMLLFQFPGNLPLDRLGSRTNRGDRADSLKVLHKSDANQKEILGSSFPSLPLSAAAKGKQIAGSVPSVSNSAKGKGISGSSINQESGYDSRKKNSLEELPKGYMGKMLVYKSGTVKLKLGDIQYDVSPGSECTFAQNVVAINTSERNCCEVGALTKRAVVSPDIDSLLDNVINLG
ncbi:hypothetical protein F511_21674 [Dorcoceras hygrometricum]|uniref:DNA-directed RNA polymerase III subunit RPC4 n=1 Tax=Dorcoceras hygrometricum TaxID=472368 RepID=A0A2Z7B7G6_9LAMI|nr:hypothetical protein F511_21674 [Dorcoceras hygrometricum]